MKISEAAMTSPDGTVMPHAKVVLKDAFRHSRMESSSGTSTSLDSPSGLERSRGSGSQEYLSCPSEGDRETDAQGYGAENLRESPSREPIGSGGSTTDSSGNQESQFVVLDDVDDDEGADDDDGAGGMADGPPEDAPGAMAVVNMPDGPKYKCNMCDRVFSSQHRLMLHVNKHMGVKPYACPLCPANFNTLASFQRHRRSHKASTANVQTHTCNLCNAQFSHIQHLTAHLRIHAEKNRNCPHCGLYIGGLRSLQKHIREEHPLMMKTGKKSKTQNCDKNAMPYLTTPIITKPVSCRLCSRQFATNRALQGHMKGHSKLYQWNPRKCKCGLLLADEAEYQRHLKSESCEASIGRKQAPMLVDTSRSLSDVSPISPGHLAGVMTHSGTRQLSPRSRSLDSGIGAHYSLMPHSHIIVSRSNTAPVLCQPVTSPVIVPSTTLPSSVLTEIPEGAGMRDAKESGRRAAGSPSNDKSSRLDGITIKTEEWSEVVDVIQVHSNSTRRDDPTLRPDLPRSEQASGSGVEGRLVRRELSVHEGAEEGEAESDNSSQPRMEQHCEHYSREGLMQPASHGGQRARPTTEATPRGGEQVSPLERRNTESPSTQISSSQSNVCAQSPSAYLALMGGRVQEGLPWRCSYCGITFEDSLMYVIHKGCHEPGSSFKCSMCGEQCSDKVNFMLHFVRGQHTKPTHV
ncbi:uncharacterized protein [Diadema antillarum]|uniref:uncharacterized protein n=1 Tax=Diadema antillarum TaxID=105358 RepID=UPI003A88C2AE